MHHRILLAGRICRITLLVRQAAARAPFRQAQLAAVSCNWEPSARRLISASPTGSTGYSAGQPSWQHRYPSHQHSKRQERFALSKERGTQSWSPALSAEVPSQASPAGSRRGPQKRAGQRLLAAHKLLAAQQALVQVSQACIRGPKCRAVPRGQDRGPP